MAAKIPTGAYIIRETETLSVLHLNAQSCRVITHFRDENRYREQQIWWIEELPQEPEEGDLESKTEPRYHISNLRSGQVLEYTSQGKLSITDQIGKTNQMWCFKEQPQLVPEGPVYYSIAGFYVVTAGLTGNATEELNTAKLGSGYGRAAEIERAYESLNRIRHWELVPPVVGIPAGWVTLHSVQTGMILRHPEVTRLPRTARLLESENGQSTPADAQWCFVEANPGPSGVVASWCIKNRCTGAILSQPEDSPDRITSYTMNFGFLEFSLGEEDSDEVIGRNDSWIVDHGNRLLHSASPEWVIRNRGTSQFLAESEGKYGRGYRYHHTLCPQEPMKTNPRWIVRPVPDFDTNESTGGAKVEDQQSECAVSEPDAVVATPTSDQSPATITNRVVSTIRPAKKR